MIILYHALLVFAILATLVFFGIKLLFWKFRRLFPQLKPPYKFTIENTGDETKKIILGNSSENRFKKNFGNPEGVSIEYGFKEYVYKQFLAFTEREAVLIRAMRVDGAKQPIQFDYYSCDGTTPPINYNLGTIAENGKVYGCRFAWSGHDGVIFNLPANEKIDLSLYRGIPPIPKLQQLFFWIYFFKGELSRIWNRYFWFLKIFKKQKKVVYKKI